MFILGFILGIARALEYLQMRFLKWPACMQPLSGTPDMLPASIHAVDRARVSVAVPTHVKYNTYIVDTYLAHSFCVAWANVCRLRPLRRGAYKC